MRAAPYRRRSTEGALIWRSSLYAIRQARGLARKYDSLCVVVHILILVGLLTRAESHLWNERKWRELPPA
jgi:hypothetical protein